jgi:hypothetical protein
VYFEHTNTIQFISRPLELNSELLVLYLLLQAQFFEQLHASAENRTSVKKQEKIINSIFSSYNQILRLNELNRVAKWKGNFCYNIIKNKSILGTCI